MYTNTQHNTIEYAIKPQVRKTTSECYVTKQAYTIWIKQRKFLVSTLRHFVST